MATKPTTLPEWDTTEVNAIEPDATHKAQGWLAPGGIPEKPPFQTFNHWMNETYKWVNYFDTAVGVKYLSDYDGDLAAAIADIGATITELWLDTSYTLLANMTTPVTLLVKPIDGNVIDRDTYNLTINKLADTAPFYWINDTDSTGTFTLPSGTKVKPEWFNIDGTSDETEINFASASISTNGGTVELNGAYIVDGAILIRDNIKYKGIGSVTFANGVSASTIMFTNDDQDVGNTEFEISGLKLDGDRANNGATSGLKAIALYGAVTKGRIADNYITGFTHSGIQIEAAAIGGAGALLGSTENIIESNIIDDYGTGASGFGIVLLRGPSRNKILNNHITSTLTNNGIAIDDYSTSGNSYDSQYNIISGNHVNGAAEGIVIEGCTYNTIENNTLRNQSSQCISLRAGTAGDGARTPVRPDHNKITDNNIIMASNTEKGVFMADGYYCQITNNDISGGLRSIELHNVAIGHKLDNNTLTNMTGNAIYAVLGHTLHITNNIIDGVISGGYCTEGIYLDSSSGSLKWAKVSGNTFDNIGKEAIKVVKGGSPLFGIDIFGNYIINASKTTASTYYGILISGVASTSWVHDNHGDSSADYLALLQIDNEATDVIKYGNSDTIAWNFSSFEMNHINATSGALTGATDKIEVDIPTGALIVGISLNNEVAVTDDAGDDTYTAAFSGGLAVSINGGAAIAAAQNTKTKELFDVNAAAMLTSGETDITLTPNGGNFSAGEVRAIVWYISAIDLPDAS